MTKKLFSFICATALLSCGAYASPRMSRHYSKKPYKPEGVYGFIMQNYPLQYTKAMGGPASNIEIVVLRARDGRFVKRARSNKRGNFKITLAPGVYVVQIRPFHKFDWTDKRIVVGRDYYTYVDFFIPSPV